jgi:hypothetical protein
MKIAIRLITGSIVLLTILISGCSTNSPNVTRDMQESFQKLVAINEMNKDLRVTTDISDNNNLHIGSVIHLVIENLSDQPILIPEPSGIKLFIINDGEWSEINNNAEYYGNSEGPVLYPHEPSELRYRTSTGVSPVLKPGTKISDKGSKIVLRILIIGEMLMNGEKTGIPVGAYTDVYLTP